MGNRYQIFMVYVFTGVYKNQAEINGSIHEASTVPGDPIIKDVNGDNKITIDDRTIIGNYQPDFFFWDNKYIFL